MPQRIPPFSEGHLLGLQVQDASSRRVGCCVPPRACRRRAARGTEIAAAAKMEGDQADRRQWMEEERAGKEVGAEVACVTFRRGKEGVAGGRRRERAFAVAASVFLAASGSAADVPDAKEYQFWPGTESWYTAMIHLRALVFSERDIADRGGVDAAD